MDSAFDTSCIVSAPAAHEAMTWSHGTGDTYFATPAYPNTTPDDGSAGAAAAAASRAPHPSGPADTSSMNASEGKSSKGDLGRQRNADIHHPGRQEEVLEGQQTAAGLQSSEPNSTPQEKEADALNTDKVQYAGNSTPQVCDRQPY